MGYPYADCLWTLHSSEPQAMLKLWPMTLNSTVNKEKAKKNEPVSLTCNKIGGSLKCLKASDGKCYWNISWRNIWVASPISKQRIGFELNVSERNGDEPWIKKSESVKLKIEFGKAKVYLRNPITGRQCL